MSRLIDADELKQDDEVTKFGVVWGDDVTRTRAIDADDIEWALYQLDLIQKPFAIAYNPKAIDLIEILKQTDFEDTILPMPYEWMDTDKVYMFDRKQMEEVNIWTVKTIIIQ